MAILSITFHTEETIIPEWEIYLAQNIVPEIEKLGNKFLLSEVVTDMLSEGRNTNLLLFFDNQEDRVLFLEQKFPAISEKIIGEFKESVLIFRTFLNTIKF